MSLRAAFLAAVMGVAALLAVVQAARSQVLSPDLEVSLAAAAEADRADQARRMALARSFNDTAELRRLEAGQAGGQFSELTVTLVQAIATRPEQIDGIVNAALRAAPQARAAVLGAIAMHFPGHLERARAIAERGPVAAPMPAPQSAASPPRLAAPPTVPVAPPAPAAAAPAAAPAPVAPPAPVVAPPSRAPMQPASRPAPPSATPPAPRPAAPATAKADDTEEMELDLPATPAAAQIDDPWEGFNRSMFAVHDGIDRFAIRPLAVGYGTVMPERPRGWIRNAFDNLKGPVRFANDLLQGEFEAARTTAERFFFNTIFGLVGLFDPATDLGLKRHPADFGQTLHSYGVKSGPYLFIPLIGPTTVRDGVGQGVDTLFSPLTYVTGTLEGLAVRGGDGLTLRETLIEPLDELRANSLDYYAALRSVWAQDRAKELNRDTSK